MFDKIKEVVQKIPTLFSFTINEVPDTMAQELEQAIKADESREETLKGVEPQDKDKLLRLMRQGNYELIVRIIKTTHKTHKMDAIEEYAKDPQKFVGDLRQVTMKQGLPVSKYDSAYNRYKSEFLKHFQESLQEWETWQLELFKFEIDILSAFLAYKTAEGKATESQVVTQLIQKLDPVVPDVSRSEVFLRGPYTSDLITTGLIGLLAVLGLVFLRKNG